MSRKHNHTIRPMRIDNRRPEQPFDQDEVRQEIVAYMDGEAQAKTISDRPTWLDPDVAFEMFGDPHAEDVPEWEYLLLEWDGHMAYQEYLASRKSTRADLSRCDRCGEVDCDRDMFESEHLKWDESWSDDYDPWEGDDLWADDRYYEGDETPNMNTRDDFWMPYATIEECREVFGGDGFSVRHHNVVRRAA